MPDPGRDVSISAALLCLILISAVGFLTAWLATDVARMPRTLYIGVLTIATLLLVGAYQWWSETGTAFWTHRWPLGIVGAAVTGLLLAILVSRMAGSVHRVVPSITTSIWEGGVYGLAEGLLLSVLPPIVVWHWWVTEYESDGWHAVLGGTLALVASVFVIVIHHLGYRTYRSALMVQPVIGCLTLSVGYVLTGSPVAAVGGHIALHLAIRANRMQLPPEYEPSFASDRRLPG